MNFQQVGAAGLTTVTEAGQCLTDTFSISNQNTVPLICGTNSGEHVYFDAADDCNNLNFQFGQTANGVTKATRTFDIKVSQINCKTKSSSKKKLSSLLFLFFLGDSDMLAPSGCTQWYTGAGPAHVSFFYHKTSGSRQIDSVISFNYRYGHLTMMEAPVSTWPIKTKPFVYEEKVEIALYVGLPIQLQVPQELNF